MFNKVIIFVVALLIGFSGAAWSLRVAFPPTLSNPVTDDQLATLNRYLKDLWDMQSGRFELDVVTTSKSAAKNGEIWIFNDGGTYKLQFKAGGAVRTLIP